MSGHRKPSAEILWRLSTNVKNLRQARGYTQHELSKLCGFAASYIGDVEQETVNITLANLEALAQGLVCLEADLLLPVREAPKVPDEGCRVKKPSEQ